MLPKHVRYHLRYTPRCEALRATGAIISDLSGFVNSFFDNKNTKKYEKMQINMNKHKNAEPVFNNL